MFTIALAVACQEEDIRNVKALIVGPPETPYEFGFFEVWFPPSFPFSSSHLSPISLASQLLIYLLVLD